MECSRDRILRLLPSISGSTSVFRVLEAFLLDIHLDRLSSILSMTTATTHLVCWQLWINLAVPSRP